MDDFYTKSFVVPFYRAFLGFFILVLLISTIFMEHKQHVLLAKKTLENDTLYFGVISTFLLFGFFQQRFQLSLMNEIRYRVFHSLAFFRTSKLLSVQLSIWPKTHALLLLYTAFLTYVGVISGSLAKPLLLWALLFVIFLVDFLLIYLKLQRPFPDKSVPKAILFPRIPFELWFLKHLASKRPLLVIGVKLISLLLLSGFFFSFSSGNYDLRWIAFGLLCVAFIHFPVWLEKVKFDIEELSFFRNLPRSFFLKSRHHLISLFLFLLPELTFLNLKFGLFTQGFTILNLSFFFIAMNLGLFGFVIFQYQDKDWTKAIVGSFFLIFILIIFGIPFYLISLLSLIAFLLGIKSPFRI